MQLTWRYLLADACRTCLHIGFSGGDIAVAAPPGWLQSLGAPARCSERARPRPTFDGYRVKKPLSALAMAEGRSSGKKCPPPTGAPVMLVASSLHNASGPPSSS